MCTVTRTQETTPGVHHACAAARHPAEVASRKPPSAASPTFAMAARALHPWHTAHKRGWDAMEWPLDPTKIC